MSTYKWTKKEMEYLVKHYENTPNSELMKVLNKSRASIAVKASQLGLTKNENVIEPYAGKKEHLKDVYREETPHMADIICFYCRRGENIHRIARDINCPEEQVAEILERCIKNGMYDYYARQENRAIRESKGGNLVNTRVCSTHDGKVHRSEYYALSAL